MTLLSPVCPVASAGMLRNKTTVIAGRAPMECSGV
jgi:hypothetical protein